MFEKCITLVAKHCVHLSVDYAVTIVLKHRKLDWDKYYSEVSCHMHR